MKRSVVAVVVTVLALAAPAAAGLPSAGILVPGRSLAGLRLGESQRAVRAALGRSHGVCDDCARSTWYVTYKPFTKQGLAVEFAGGRVSGLYTLWKPRGWHTESGLYLGATPLQVHHDAGFLRTIACAGYDALAADGRRARTVYYLFHGTLWGFGLFRRQAAPCR